MATLNTTFPTLGDHARRMDPNGSIAQIIEALEKENPILQDAVFVEGNLADGHKFTSRESLPTVQKRRFNEGVPASKSRTSQVKEPVALYNAQSTVDVLEANLNGNAPAFRYSEDLAFMQAMNQNVESGMIYDAESDDPKNMNGLLPRLDSTTGEAGKQIVLHDTAGGSTSASMLLVGWGRKAVHGIFPKGIPAGLQKYDMGQQLVYDSNNNRFRAFVTDWTWQVGVAVEDKRRIAAVRNIDMATIRAGTSGSVSSPVNSIIVAAIKAYGKLFQPNAVKLAWYLPRELATYLHLQAVSSVSHSTLGIVDVAGQPVTMLLGAPVRICDSMTTTEAQIS